MKKFIEAKNFKIEYIELGSETNPKLLLLCGANNTPETYEKVIELLSRDFHVLCPYYPGFGNTTKPEVHNLLNYLNFLDVFIKELGLDEFIYLGVSFGTYLAVEYLAVNPQVQRKIKLMVWASPMIKLQTYNYVEMGLRFLLHEVQSLTTKKKSKLMPSIFSPKNIFAPKQQSRHSNMILNLKTNEHLFDSVDLKTLVVLGMKDYIVDSRYTLKLLHDNKNVRLHRIDSLGHDAFSQIGEDLNKLILNNL